MSLPGGAARLHLRLGATKVEVECPRGTAREAHQIVAGMLGLEQDAAAFARLAARLGFARLVAGREGLRISLTPSVFAGLLWAILGQQINFPFACRLKRRLFEHCGTRVGDTLFAPPTPEAVARLSIGDLLPLQFSKQKAGYVIAAARLIAEGGLKLDELRTHRPANMSPRATRR